MCVQNCSINSTNQMINKIKLEIKTEFFYKRNKFKKIFFKNIKKFLKKLFKN